LDRLVSIGARQERRGLVPFEIAVVLAAAASSLPIPVVIPLLAAASLSMWARGRSFAAVTKGPPLYAVIGVAAGAVSLVLALIVGTPLVERMTDQAVQWSMYPIVRGSLETFGVVAILVSLGAVAAELVLRGWLVERVLELTHGNAVLAILCGALAEALVSGGDLTARVGAGLFGIAMGWMFIAGGRSVTAPVCARLTFSLGALVLEALHVIG
jgi:hypothetical protein